MTHGKRFKSRWIWLLAAAFASVVQAEESQLPVDDETALVAYLQARRYTGFPVAEPEIHSSKNVHGKLIRTFLNKEMADGLKRRLVELPRNSASVKEIYTPEGKLDGWAVSAKLEDNSARGGAWYWYEVIGMATGRPEITANSRGGETAGARLCVSCHQAGYDYVLTRLPAAAR